MKVTVRRKIAMAVRVRDFARAHAAGDAGHLALLAELEERLARVEALVLQQREGTAQQHAATVQRRALRERMQDQVFPYLAQVGKRVAREVPDLLDRFVLPPADGPYRSFQTAAKAMLAEATAEREKFLKLGLSEAVLDQLGQAVGEFDALTEKTHEGRRAHVGAVADLTVVTDEVMSLVSELDAVTRFRFGDDPERMAAWRSARNVVGPFRAQKQGPEPPAEGTPPAGGVSPAA